MKIIGFEELMFSEFSIFNVDVLTYKPMRRYIDHTKTGRTDHGFLWNIAGHCEYNCIDGRKIIQGPNSLIYLPRGSKHIFRALDEDLVSMRINFDSYLADNTEIVFSDSPYIITTHENSVLLTGLEHIRDAANLIEAKAAMWSFLNEVCRYLSEKNSDHRSLTPALTALRSNPSLNVEALAALCHLSESYFRRLFREKYGIPPSDYIMKLRIERACSCLLAGLSVERTATDLGYADSSYFCRAFHKVMGLSPAVWARQFHDNGTQTQGEI